MHSLWGKVIRCIHGTAMHTTRVYKASQVPVLTESRTAEISKSSRQPVPSAKDATQWDSKGARVWSQRQVDCEDARLDKPLIHPLGEKGDSIMISLLGGACCFLLSGHCALTGKHRAWSLPTSSLLLCWCWQAVCRHARVGQPAKFDGSPEDQ